MRNTLANSSMMDRSISEADLALEWGIPLQIPLWWTRLMQILSRNEEYPAKFLYDRRDRCRSRLGMRKTRANSSMTDRSMQISSRNEEDPAKFLYDRRDRCRSRLGMRKTRAKSSMTDRSMQISSRNEEDRRKFVGSLHVRKSNLDRIKGQRKKITSKTIISQVLKP